MSGRRISNMNACLVRMNRTMKDVKNSDATDYRCISRCEPGWIVCTDEHVIRRVRTRERGVFKVAVLSKGAGAYANRVAQTFLVQSEVKRLQGINVLKTWYTGYSSEYCEFAAVPQDTVTPAVVSSPPLGDTPFEVAAPCIEHAQPVEPAVSLLADEHVAATMLWRAAYSASNKDIMQYQVARRLCPNMTAHKMDAIFAADPLLCGHMPKLAAAQQQFLLKHGGTMNTSASAGDTVEVFKVHAARMCALFTIMRTVFKEQPPLEMNSTRTFFAVMGAYGLNTPLTNGVCFNNCCYVMRRRIEKAVHAQHVAHFNETVTHAIVY